MRNLLTIAALFAGLLTSHAQTNFFPFLKAGNEIYQNARIVTNTPSYAVIFYDGGAVHVAFSNLPVEIQKQYHYDSSKAAKFEAAKKSDVLKRKQAELQAMLAKQQLEYAQAVAEQVARSNNFKPVEIKWTNYFGAIFGIVTNNTDTEYENVWVTFALMDGNKQLKTCKDYTEYLGPHCIWEPKYIKDERDMGSDAKLLSFTYRKKEKSE